MREYFKQEPWLKNMFVLGLAALCIYLSLNCFKKWELLLQYQYYWLKINDSLCRISAMLIRLLVLIIFILILGAVWFVVRRVLHKKALCPLLAAPCLLCAINIYLLNIYGDTWVWLHVGVEYMFSIYTGNYQGDITVLIDGDTVTIPHSLNDGLSYYDYETETDYQWNDLELMVTFSRDDTWVATAVCIAEYDSETDAYIAEIPELLADYQCALLTVRAGGDNGSIYTGICLGSLKTTWYQRVLKTDIMLLEDLDMFVFDDAIEEGKIGAGAVTRTIWGAFNAITCDDFMGFFMGCFAIYAVILLLLTGLSIVAWLYYNYAMKG